MGTTIRHWNRRGELVGIRIVGDVLAYQPVGWRFFEDQYHPTLSADDVIKKEYERYAYLREQLELNSARRGVNLVDEERSRHILEGDPIFRSVRSRDSAGELKPTTTVIGWSGGHANPDAAQYGKTQIPDFWTGERFMYEVSDILSDANSRWYRQEASEESPEYNERYVCVEERYGVPIRVVAERVDDVVKCVTAFPDYGESQFDENLRVDGEWRAPGDGGANS